MLLWLTLLCLSASLVVKASSPCLTVTFDDALTNSTDWVYSSGVKYMKERKCYALTAHGAMIGSPRLDFALTSVTVRAFSTSTNALARRNLKAAAWDTYFCIPESVRAIDLSTTEADCTAAWPPSAAYDRLVLYCDAGQFGNTYLRTATLRGIPFVLPPAHFALTALTPTACAFSWSPDTNAFRTDVALCLGSGVPSASALTNAHATRKCSGSDGSFTNLTPSTAYTAWACSYDETLHRSEWAGPIVLVTPRAERGMAILVK